MTGETEKRKVQVGDVWRYVPTGLEVVVDNIEPSTRDDYGVAYRPKRAENCALLLLDDDGLPLYPEQWTLVRPAPSSQGEAPQIKVGQRRRATSAGWASRVRGQLYEVIATTGNWFTARFENGKTHDYTECQLRDDELVSQEPPKPAVGQVWRAIEGEPWCSEAKGQEVEVLSIDDDSAVVRWRYDNSRCCYGLRLFSPSVAHFEFVSHGAALQAAASGEDDDLPWFLKDPGDPKLVIKVKPSAEALADIERIKAAKNQPQPRCGQTWLLSAASKEPQAGQRFDIYDMREDEHGRGALASIRYEDGSQHESVPACQIHVMATYVSGPTTPETPREAFERVVRLEAADVPEGLSADRWLGMLVNKCARVSGDSHERHSATGRTFTKPEYVRMLATQMRKEHAARWQAWREDASRGVK